MAFIFTSSTNIAGLVVVEPQIHIDERGWFLESYKRSEFTDAGISIHFAQISNSLSRVKGTIRGLHFQLIPYAQGKLIRCLRGKIFDVAVDLRRGSPTYLSYDAIELSQENKRLFWIPEGFAHGFCALTTNVEIEYSMTNEYSPENERSLLWNDPDVGVKWPTQNPIISQKDAAGFPASKLDHNFVWKR